MTSVKGRLAVPNASIGSRMLGDDGAEELELGSLEWPLREKVGVVGEGYSDMVEERERGFPSGVEQGESIAIFSSALLRASTSCGSISGFNWRPRIVSPCIRASRS